MRFVRSGRPRAAAATVAMAAVLCGCISLLPKTKPVQLYRFGDSPSAAAAAGAAVERPVGVVLGPIGFPRAAVGDQLLTVTGNTAAYVASARWVAPASVLFEEQIERAFDRQARSVRLLQRGEVGQARAVLRLDVRTFETRYDAGAGAAPAVAVSVHGALSRPDGRTLDERVFDVRQPAGDNRVSAIVAAYDQATAQATSQVIAWTDDVALRTPAPPDSAQTSAFAAPAETSRSSRVRPPLVSRRPGG